MNHKICTSNVQKLFVIDTHPKHTKQTETVKIPFLSPPVLLHGGLICLAFCLSTCLSRFVCPVLLHWYIAMYDMSQGQITWVPKNGRGVHINIKLLRLGLFLSGSSSCSR